MTLECIPHPPHRLLSLVRSLPFGQGGGQIEPAGLWLRLVLQHRHMHAWLLTFLVATLILDHAHVLDCVRPGQHTCLICPADTDGHCA